MTLLIYLLYSIWTLTDISQDSVAIDRYGTLCLRENQGCLFIATNCDAVTHLTDAQEWAGKFCTLFLPI
jgi:hypothetical protein